MAGGSAQMSTPVRARAITVPADEGQLGRVRDFIVEVCVDAGLGPRETSNTKLAVDEACTNIIKHAYEGGSGEINVRVEMTSGEVKIILQDRGKRFDYSSVEDPDLDQYVETGRKGGLGVFLINRLMDDVHYHSSGNTNQLVLVKRTQSALSALSIQQRPIRSTLKFKFTLRAGSGLFLLMLVMWGFIFARQTNDIKLQTTSRWVESRRLAESLSNRSVEVLLQPDELSVEQTNMTNYLAKLVVGSSEVAYARVIDARGLIVSSAQIDEIFTPYQDSGGEVILDEGGRMTWKRVMLGDRDVRDIGAEVRVSSAGNTQAARLGYVHLGIYEDVIDSSVKDTRLTTSLLLFAVFLVGLLLIVGLVQVFVRPIQMLTDGVRAIGDGNLEGKLDVQGPAEIGAIAAVFNEITNKFKAAQNSILEQEKIHKEMEVAKEIQHSLLPSRRPEVSGYDIAPLYQAAAEVGGDYYDFVQVDEDTIGVVVADVSGKGVPGSLVMTMIRTALRMEARGNKNASDVMAKMNAFVTDDMKKGMFVTMFYVILDSKNRIISYASAGHNPMILYRAETNETFFLNPKGFPVGISLPDEELFRKSITLEKIKLKKDDMLLIYTDGVTEAMNTRREQYGEDRLLHAIKEWGGLTPEQFIDKLEGDIKKFTAGHPQNDDITVVAIKEKLAADDVLFGIRKKLIELVDVQGMSVKEACHQMRVSPATYYRYKRRLEEMGERGLQNDVLRKDVTINRVSLEARKEILHVMTEHPEYGAKRLADEYNEGRAEAALVTERMVYEELKRLNLNTRALRIEYLRRNRLLGEDGELEIRRDSREIVEDLLKDIPGVEVAAGVEGGAADEFADILEAERVDGVGLSTSRIGDVTELYVEGHIDSVASATLEQRLRALIEQGAHKIIVDLSDVSYISSGGWGIFTGEVKHLREQGGDVVLVGMTSEVYDVYELLGFADVIRAFATVEAARDHIRKPAAERFAAPARSERLDTESIAAEYGVELESARDMDDDEIEAAGDGYSAEWESLQIEATTVGAAGDIAVVALQGIIDTVSAENLRSALGNVLSRGIHKVVVDMSRVEYVSSGGWGTFTERLREVRRAGGDIKLFGMDPDVYYVFTMLGFNIVLSSFDILAAAIEDFERGAADKADPESVGMQQLGAAPVSLATRPALAPAEPSYEDGLDDALDGPPPARPIDFPQDDIRERPEEVAPPSGPLPPREATRPSWGAPDPGPRAGRAFDELANEGSEDIVKWEDADGGVRIARLHGPIEAVAVQVLAGTLERELSRRPRAVMFDFGDVPYVSSTGWGQVAGCYEACQAWGATVAIFGLNQDLHDIFTCLEFHTFIGAYDSQAQALRSLPEAGPGDADTIAAPPELAYAGSETLAYDQPGSDVEVAEGVPVSIDDVLGDDVPAEPSPLDTPAAADRVDVESATVDKNVGRDKKLRDMGWSEYGERLRRIMEKEQNRGGDE
jgi:anti-anti-sigma factor